jgi:drug/metabolite transporter (DMT)-like permease
VDIDISLDYATTLLAALLIGTGFVLQQQAARREPDSHFLSWRLITDLIRKPRWLTGIACMIGGQILAAWSIGHLELSFVEPLLATNLIFALLLAVPLAKASLKVWEVLGAAVLCTGVALLSLQRSVKPVGESFGSFSHWPAAAAIAFIAFVAVQIGRGRSSRTRAMLTGVGAGLVFGIQDALTRQTLDILQSNGISGMFRDWAPYALVGAGAIGIWLMQSAFSAGSLQVSLPAISAGEPLVGILLGVLVFGDRIQLTPGLLAIQAGGIAALIVGVIMVARGPALSQLRSWTETGISHTPLRDLPGIRPERSGDESDSDEPADGHPANANEPANGQPGDANEPANRPSRDADELANGPSPNGHRGTAHPAAGEHASAQAGSAQAATGQPTPAENARHLGPDMHGLTRPPRQFSPPGCPTAPAA